MRRALGALNWRAVQTSPWLLSTVSHLQGCVETATVHDLMEANKATRWQRRHSHVKLIFPHQVQDNLLPFVMPPGQLGGMVVVKGVH